MRISLLVALSCAPLAGGHAILSVPAPRSGTNIGVGTKLTPFADASTFALECGGTRNSDPGVEQPTVAYTPGETIDLTWVLTIPHAIDRLTDGVRVAIHYDDGDTFSDNILDGGVGTDPLTGTVPVADADAEADDEITFQVTLPTGKTCDYCTLQWIWSAQNDGGSYLACADISITTNGQLPNFNNVPSEVGKVLPGVGVAIGDGNTGGDGAPSAPPPPSTVSIDMPATGTPAAFGTIQRNQLIANMATTLGVLQANVALTVAAKDSDSVDLAFVVTVASDAESDAVKAQADARLSSASTASLRLGTGLVGFTVEDTPVTVQNNGQGGGGGGGGSDAGTVIGVLIALFAVGGFAYWYLKVRPNGSKPPEPGAAGKYPPAPTYQAGAGMPPPPPPPPVGSGLPPGWSEAKDANSGVTYYYNASTGATQWTMPNHV